MKLERTLKQYAGIVPGAIVNSSPAAIGYFVRDAQKDIATLAKELAAKDAEIERMRKALEEIRDLEPTPFNAYPADWKEQIAACEKCQDYKDHPIMRGICDTHRRPMNDRESHDAHQVRSLGYRAKGMARDALDGGSDAR